MPLDRSIPEFVPKFGRDGRRRGQDFRQDVKPRLGINYDAFFRINPRIIYGSISEFGQEGPYHKSPGCEQIAQRVDSFSRMSCAIG